MKLTKRILSFFLAVCILFFNDAFVSFAQTIGAENSIVVKEGEESVLEMEAQTSEDSVLTNSYLEVSQEYETSQPDNAALVEVEESADAVTEADDVKEPAVLKEASNSEYVYEILSNGNVRINKYIGSGSNVIIPAKIDGCTVTEIQNRMFENTTISQVTIPATVTSAYSAFEDSGVERAIFEDGIESIPMGIFANVSTLKEVVIPESVKKIEIDAFFGCSLLSDVILPDDLIEIEAYAFMG